MPNCCHHNLFDYGYWPELQSKHITQTEKGVYVEAINNYYRYNRVVANSPALDVG